MKKIRQNLFARLFALTFIITAIACGESENKIEKTKATELKVELNEGEKWEANRETTQGIENMENILNQFDKDSDIQAYNSLAKELASEFTMIFKKCTMKGEAHNQLHNYLIPLKDYMKGLGSDQQQTAEKNYEKIIPHLAAYSLYFK